MKKFVFITVILFSPFVCFSQNNWISTFFNNTSTFSKIIKRDSLNFFAFCHCSKYYYKSSDGGNNWISNAELSFDSTYSIFDGQFINYQTGWIVGVNIQSNNGALFKTVNGGENWILQDLGSQYYGFNGIYFLNLNTGWFGGQSYSGSTGLLFHTTDGGSNWTYQSFPGAYQIGSIRFFTNNEGWIMGHYGFIAKTTNGGQNWIQKTVNNVPPTYVNNHDLFALNINECWILVVSANAGLTYSNILRTTDGGDNWNLTYSYTDSLNTNALTLGSLEFLNTTTGFSFGNTNFILRTSNSGINWTKTYTYPDIGYNYSINSILPINNYNVFSCGGYISSYYYDKYNYILKSTNSGLNWVIKSNYRELSFSTIEFINNNTGFVLGDSGCIYKTSNFGIKWNLIYKNTDYWLRQISFANSTTGCIIASQYSYDNYGRILRTSNCGENWSEIINLNNKPIYSLKFISPTLGLIGCDSNKILKSTNYGISWDTNFLSHPVPFNIKDFSFINNSTGWALGYYHHGYLPYWTRNSIWKTTNGGNDWNTVFDSLGSISNFKIHFTNNNTGYKLSGDYNYIQKTSNGGINWFNISIPYITRPSCIIFVNDNTGWIGGEMNQSLGSGKIIKTTNGGVNWFLQFNEYRKNVVSIYAFDSDNAWFCGKYSSIYHTTNGGGVIGINCLNNTTSQSFSLSQNYPNPFNPTTNIKYQITQNKLVTLKIFDILGKEIATLVDEKQSPGTYEVNWEASAFPSGVYFYKLSAGDFTETKKMLLIK